MVGLDALGANPEPVASVPKRSRIFPTVAAIVGAVVGGLLWKPHRTLGVFVGSGVGGSVAEVVNGGDGWDVLTACTLAASGYGVSKLWKVHPIAGFIGGAALGEVTILRARGVGRDGYVLAGT